ncbi:hypothetical protein [Amycolatopsis nigrescens]|uniref:hypothetical protein n=1 Tax=Amycolatopsis nigrescens TaxID=381445 RepID=UPI0003805B23|nr:hypothetical protein [Amycolatopsis nigrescens]
MSNEPDLYRPVVGGVRHRTEGQGRPAAGSTVELLCGARYQVSSRTYTTHVYHDCPACDEINQERGDQRA